MLNSPVLEVAIGMIFFYLLLSLICSALNEMIEAWWKNRARDLESGIRRILDDEIEDPSTFVGTLGRKIVRFFKILVGRKLNPPLGAPTGLAGKLYDHALVRGLYLDKRELPSYIPARNFALALMDLAAPGGAKGATGDTIQAGPVAALQVLRAGIADPNRIPSARVRDALTALIDAAGDDPVKVRENIENWYNSSMDRVAGWYKRRTQVIVLVLGFGVAIATNSDSVAVVNSLWLNSDLRSGVMKAAEAYTQDQRDQPLHQQQAAKPREQLSSLELPVGWNGPDPAHTMPPYIWQDFTGFFRVSGEQLHLHWLGWLITGLAISLGAPFWFDLLNKFMVVRSTIKPQEKSPDEPAKT